MRAETIQRQSGWCAVRPTCADWLAHLGLQTARDFLALPGVVVSGHVGRNVSRVQLGDTIGYLKREHRVRTRDRFRSLLAGFGPVSLSQRERIVIGRLDAHMLQSPHWLAVGEAEGQAFLLLEQAHGAVSLRHMSEVSAELAEQVGGIIARIHAAGIDQPDLFAKHVLVNPETGHVTIIDWQRASLRDVVPLRRRVRALAALRATSPEELISPGNWHRLLRSYAKTSAVDSVELARRVDAAARDLRARRVIRAQFVPVAGRQELVRIGGETVCAIPEIADQLGQPDQVASLYDPANDGRTFRLRNGRSGVLHVSRYRSPLRRWWDGVRGKTWRSNELKAARLLFHLERYGIAGPSLLAYGQKVDGIGTAGSFVLFEPSDGRRVGARDTEQLSGLLARLHEADCCLRSIGENGEPFGMREGRAAVIDVRHLRLNRRIDGRQRARDQRRLQRYLEGRR